MREPVLSCKTLRSLIVFAAQRQHQSVAAGPVVTVDNLLDHRAKRCVWPHDFLIPISRSERLVAG